MAALHRFAFFLLAFVVAGFVRADGPDRKPPIGFGVAEQISDVIRAASDKVKPAMVTLDVPQNRVSGFLVDPSGLILTVYKPIKDLKEVTVWLEGNRKKTCPGKVVVADADSGLAIVQIEGEKFPYVRFGDSDGRAIGEWVFAIGEQRGMTQSVSAGIVSSAPRLVGGVKLIQTQVPTDGGNLGGPLIDSSGAVIGIVNRIPSRRGEFGPPPKGGKAPPATFSSPAFEGVTFAIPSNIVKQELPKLMKDVKLVAAENAKPTPAMETLQHVGAGVRSIAEQVSPAVVTMKNAKGNNCSGVLVDKTGHIVTHSGVVQAGDGIKVVHAGKTYAGKVVASDKATGLGLVKIDGDDFPFVRLGDSSAIKASDWVVTLGAPFELDRTIGLGVIGKTTRKVEKIDMLQASTPINPANTGGPLVNDRGEVIGIVANNAGASFRGLAFAIPSNAIKETLTARDIVLPSGPAAAKHPGCELIRQLGEAFRWAADQVRPAVCWTGGGCGVVISDDGYIVTNNHVVGAAKSIKVSFPGGDKSVYTAKVVAHAPRDIALLKIDAKDFPYARMGDSDLTRVGEWILSIGGPLTLTDTVTEGTISGKDRGWPAKKLQHDSPINPGNSGGVLINLLGEVIAMNGTTEGTYVSYGTPINYVKQIMDEMRAGVSPGRGVLGVQLEDVTDAIARANKLPEAKGATLASISPDSAAEKGGLKTGDVVTHFNGFAVRDQAELGYVIRLARPGTTAVVDVIRNGMSMKIEVTVGEKAKT